MTSSGDSSNNALTSAAAAEIEMTSVLKLEEVEVEVEEDVEEEVEEEEIQTFVDENTGEKYFINPATGQSQWVTDEA